MLAHVRFDEGELRKRYVYSVFTLLSTLFTFDIELLNGKKFLHCHIHPFIITKRKVNTDNLLHMKTTSLGRGVGSKAPAY